MIYLWFRIGKGVIVVEGGFGSLGIFRKGFGEKRIIVFLFGRWEIGKEEGVGYGLGEVESLER